MLLRAWIASVVLTLALFALTLVAESQQGECFDGDPIPNCPNASGLADWGYFIGGLFWEAAAVCLVLTLTALWKRVAKPTPSH